MSTPATQKFIERAVEGGYRMNGLSDIALYAFSGSEMHQNKALLDPEAWKAVGKVLGWEDSLWIGQMSQLVGEKLETHKWEVPQWQYAMHRMIDAIAEGKTPEQFLSTLFT